MDDRDDIGDVLCAYVAYNCVVPWLVLCCCCCSIVVLMVVLSVQDGAADFGLR